MRRNRKSDFGGGGSDRISDSIEASKIQLLKPDPRIHHTSLQSFPSNLTKCRWRQTRLPITPLTIYREMRASKAWTPEIQEELGGDCSEVFVLRGRGGGGSRVEERIGCGRSLDEDLERSSGGIRFNGFLLK